MNERTSRVSDLLHQAAETHHTVYRIVDGADDDWALWYADWLQRLSALPQALGVSPTRSELVYLLVKLDKEYTSRKSTLRWEDYYAEALLDHFGSVVPSAA
jgi:hypothetical protein